MAEAAMTQKSEVQKEGGQEYVTFSLNSEMYAIDALNVQEIIELTTITKVPHLPGFFKGVINLRGTIIPVVDLKQKFGMMAEGYQNHTCIIVTEFSGGVMGLIVDAVSDVLNMPGESISATPAFGARINTDFMRGMGRVGESLVLVLDVDRVLSDDEAFLLSDTMQQETVEAVHKCEGAKAIIDFTLARNKHLLWKARLRAFLDGKESITVEEAVSHKECELGKWLYAEGIAKYGSVPEMKDLERVHADLHAMVKRVVELQHFGDTSAAEQEYAKLEALSQAIISLLNELERAIA